MRQGKTIICSSLSCLTHFTASQCPNEVCHITMIALESSQKTSRNGSTGKQHQTEFQQYPSQRAEQVRYAPSKDYSLPSFASQNIRYWQGEPSIPGLASNTPSDLGRTSNLDREPRYGLEPPSRPFPAASSDFQSVGFPSWFNNSKKMEAGFNQRQNGSEEYGHSGPAHGIFDRLPPKPFPLHGNSQFTAPSAALRGERNDDSYDYLSAPAADRMQIPLSRSIPVDTSTWTDPGNLMQPPFRYRGVQQVGVPQLGGSGITGLGGMEDENLTVSDYSRLDSGHRVVAGGDSTDSRLSALAPWDVATSDGSNFQTLPLGTQDCIQPSLAHTADGHAEPPRRFFHAPNATVISGETPSNNITIHKGINGPFSVQLKSGTVCRMNKTCTASCLSSADVGCSSSTMLMPTLQTVRKHRSQPRKHCRRNSMNYSDEVEVTPLELKKLNGSGLRWEHIGQLCPH